MSNDFVTWGDYENVDGFGPTSPEHLADLKKALVMGADRDPPATAVAGDGFALRTESLERTMKVTTYKMEHLVLFKDLIKLPAYNTVEEYNRLLSYGDNPDGGWMAEGALPEEEDSTYERVHSFVKFLGVVGRVTHVATLTRPAFGNNVARETVNRTMYLLKILERALFYGDSDLQALQFDGFFKLIQDSAPTANIIDMRGLPFSEDVLNDAALTIFDDPNFGVPTDVYMNPKVKADLAKTFFPNKRYDAFAKPNDGMVGLDIAGFQSAAGAVRFKADVFINDGGAAPATAQGEAAKRPQSPSVTTTSTTPPDPDSQFTADDAGNYFYKAVAVNQFGHSAAVTVPIGGATVAVASGDKTTFGLTPQGGITVDYYKIYRSEKAGAAGSERLILRVKNAATFGEQTIDDYNAILPYTTQAAMFQFNDENLAFKQLAPMTRLPLAQIDTSVRWAQVIYGVPQLYTPGKNVLFVNIGRSAGYVGQP